MSVIISKTHADCEISMSRAYFEFLRDNMKKDENLMHIEVDLWQSLLKLKSSNIQDKYPFQYLNVGISEANEVSVAAGLSTLGFIPFVHSFASFISRRAYDQVFISSAYSCSNIKLIGSDPGIMTSFNGGTHIPLEDAAIMHSIPNMTIVEPTDTIIAKDIFRLAKETEGMFYIRFTRKQATQLYEEGSTFGIGKGNVIYDGTDVTIIACGIMVKESLKAVEILKKQGVSARLVNMFTIKPIDKELVLKCASETGAIVTAENHNVINGLGAAIAEVINENCLIPLERIGVQDRFGQVGDVDLLKKEYRLTAEDIVKKAQRAISRKK